jgi:hypothetical protein
MPPFPPFLPLLACGEIYGASAVRFLSPRSARPPAIDSPLNNSMRERLLAVLGSLSRFSRRAVRLVFASGA